MADILIIEGAHRTGKSSLSKELVKNGYSYFKDMTAYSIKGKTIEEQKKIFHDIVFSVTQFAVSLPSECAIILDRHHLTDAVYGFAYRNDTAKNFTYIDALLSLKNAKLILTDDDEEKINERYGEDISETTRLFRALFYESKLEKIKVNIKDVNLQEQLSDFLNKKINLGLQTKNIIV